MSQVLLAYQKRIFYLGGICSTLLYLLQNLGVLSTLWIICTIPFLISLMIVPGITYTKISKDCPKIESFSFHLLQFCSINISLFTSLFATLLSLHLDESISASWTSIYISLWYTFLIYFILCAFLLPGLFTVQMKREALLILFWGITGLITSILVPLCADFDWKNDWVVLLPFSITCIASSFIYIYVIVNDISRLGREGLFYAAILAGVIILLTELKEWIFLVIAIYLISDWILSEIEIHVSYQQLD